MARTKQMRIFILEDEIHIQPRKAILDVLKGHEITLALNKLEALKLYKPPYSLAIVDHDMYGWPDPDYHPNSGYAFLEWLVDQEWKLPHVAFHSQNWMWMPKLVQFMKDHGQTPTAIPFGNEYLRWLERFSRGELK